MDLLEKGFQYFYKSERPAAKTYHGLINQGATCYLNSVLQVLFMTEDFREAVKRHTWDHSGPERIDGDLTSLFDDLQQYAGNTYKITKKLNIDNVYEQRDAAEYFEKILGLTSDEASQIFHGQQTQKTTCSTCLNNTDSDAAFWNLTLALVNSYKGDYSVVDGIEEYFRHSHFSGENQMYCDKCDAKSDATIKWEIKDHPEVLMLLLKRFQFDYRYMTYVKINCTVNVPCTLQIPENQTYELYAVVDHFGDLWSGHYTATIKHQDSGTCYNFNDERVTLLPDQPFQVDNFMRSSSAYLLFYRKKKVLAADTCTQDTREMSSPGGFPPANRDISNDQFKAEVKTRETEKIEWEVEVKQSIDRNGKPGIKDIFVFGSNEVGLSSDLKEDQDNRVYSRQSIHQDRNELSYQAEKLRHKDEIMTDDEEDQRENAQTVNQTERRGSLSAETQLEQSVVGPIDDSIRTGDVRHRRPQEGPEGEDMNNAKQKQEVSNMHPQKVGVDMQKDEEEMAMDVNRDEGGRKGRRGSLSGVTQLEQSVDGPIDDSIRTGDVRHRRPQEGLEGEDMNNAKQKQEVGNMHPQKVGVDMQKDEEEMSVDVNRDEGGRKVRRGIASTKYRDGDEERRDNEGLDNVRQNTEECPEGTQVVSQDTFKPVSVDKPDNEEKKAVRGKLLTIQDLYNDGIQGNGVGKSKQNMPKDDQRFKRKIESRFYKSHEPPREEERDVKGDKQQKRGDEEYAQRKGASERQEWGQNGRSERVTTQEDVDAAKRAKGGNEYIQRRADSSLRQAGSSRVTGNRGDGSVEESQPLKARTGLNEETMEGKRSSKQSKTYHVKIIEEETHSDGGKSTVTKNMRITTVEGDPRGSIESLVGNAEIESDPKTYAKVTLGVGNLQLNDSHLLKRQKRHSSLLTQNQKEKKKCKMTPACCFPVRQTSDSD